MATAVLLRITDTEASYWTDVVDEHDQGRQRCCLQRARCTRYLEALAALAMGGRVDWDPIRESRIKTRSTKDSPPPAHSNGNRGG